MKCPPQLAHQAGRRLEPLPARFSLGGGFEPGAGRGGARFKWFRLYGKRASLDCAHAHDEQELPDSQALVSGGSARAE
eukprot:1749266-Amphidinium_carterae.2